MAAPQATSACEANDWLNRKVMNEIDVKSWSSQSSGNKRIGVALVGMGRMGRVHFRNFMREPRANLKYCVDVDESTLAACKASMYFRELGIQALHSDQFEVVLQDPEVQVVVVVTPSDQHEDLTRRALSAGKNVMCEKPLSPRTDCIMPLYELAKANKVFLLTGFNKAYDPDYRHMRMQVKTGAVGTVQLIRITSRDCPPPPLSYVRTSSGLFHDSCIHDFNMCLWLMRQLPKSVQVVGKTWKEVYLNDPEQYATLSASDRELLPEVDDYFTAIMTIKFENGSLVVIDSSRQASYGCDQRIEILGSKAMLQCGGAKSNNVTRCDSSAVGLATLPYGIASRYLASYTYEIEDMLRMGDLASEGMYDNSELVKQRLMEPIRPSLVFATHHLADSCVEAGKTGNTVEINWTEQFRQQFKAEIEP